ncbi:hypothetical protein [Streptomyces longwoodensis]|uniref:hypothetical protein n=1 Tax=Streptomyces longwoodensis TaxID=68231 RepID=UPI00340A3AFD
MRIDPVGRPETSPCPAATSRIRWLVGLPFPSAAARVVRCYYVVADADDGAQAVGVALERADGEQGGAACGRQLAPGKAIEVQRILRDPIGHTSLVSWP